MSEIPVMRVTDINQYPLTHSELELVQKTEQVFRVIILSAFSLYTLKHLRELVKMIRSSNTLVGKGAYQIMTDLTEDKKMLQLCDVLTGRICKFYDELPEALSKWSYHGIKDAEDNSEAWADLIDVATKLYDPLAKSTVKTLKEVFRKVMKPYDGVAFYRFISCLYLSMVLDNLFVSFYRSMEHYESKPFKRLDLVPLMRSMIHHSGLKDVNGKYFFLTFGSKEYDALQEAKRKPYFRGRRTNEWLFQHCDSLIQSDELNRKGYEFEKVIFSFHSLRTINKSVGATTYDYEKIFKMQYDAPCMTTYPQYALVIALKKGHWKKARLLLEQFVNEIPEYRGRKTQPVFGFFVGDKFEFKGAWNSAGEAARECGWFFKDIAFNVRQNDKRVLIENCDYKKIHNHVWVSLKRFMIVLDELAA